MTSTAKCGDTAALIAHIRELERTVARLVDENTHLHHRLACHRDWTLLSPEILLCIFHSMPSRRHSLDPSLSLGPRSLWMETMRTKKALALVCKSWHGPAIEVLYEDIVIRRMGQIVALARTLQSERAGFARLVKVIHIDTLAIFPSCSHVVKEDFETIMSQCTMLKEFSIYYDDGNLPYLDEVDVNGTVHAYIPTWIVTSQGCPIYQQLQRLHFITTLKDRQLPVLHGLLANAVHLVSLMLCTYQPVPSECFSSLEPLSLPTLEELTISTLVDYVTTKWILPKLHSLTILHVNALPVDLLRAHGRLLRYLHLYKCYIPRNRSAFSLHGLEQLSELCPTLRHLVLPQTLRVGTPDVPLFTCTLAHLECLDIWAANYDIMYTDPFLQRDEFERIHSVMEKSEVRATCAIRVIALLDDIRMMDLPRVFPPGGVEPGEWRVHEVPGARVIQTSWALLTDRWPYAVLKCGCGAVPGRHHTGGIDGCFREEEGYYGGNRTALKRNGSDTGSDEDGSGTDEDGDSEESDTEEESEDTTSDGSGTGSDGDGSGVDEEDEDEDTDEDDDSDEEKTEEDMTSLISDSSGTGSEDDDGSGVDEDDGSDLDLSRENAGYEEQLDRDTILEMFGRSQHAWFEIDGLYDVPDGIARGQNLLTLSTDPWRGV
ncbi:hypothetical protein C8Q74DRAFT_1447650 [Fomes fomentarius]|nr:hypothetical protein C8Q74DRAFT_1447650 [Fomes fomentarius]